MVENLELAEPTVMDLHEASGAPLWRERFLGGSPDREQELFAGFARDIKQLQRAVERRSKAGQVLRGFHAKTIAAVRATLRLRADLPPDLCTGFLQPGAELPVIVRFSASSHDIKPDSKRNGRGAALRIEHAGRAYDLLFSDSPRSHARDAQQFMTFVKVLSAPWWWKPVPLVRELGARESARLVRGVIEQTFSDKPTIAGTRFWGKTPMRIGDYAVKYQLLPSAAPDVLSPNGQSFMREDLLRRIAAGDVRYTLCMQRFVDELRTPLEDHSVEWPERDAPLEKLGELCIERGAFARQAPDFEAEVERMAFNPWNTSELLRPLGSLNRARKAVYAASADERSRPERRTWGRRLEERLGEPLLSALSVVFERVNHRTPWHELPRYLGTANLYLMRRRMREKNLFDTEDMLAVLEPSPKVVPQSRSADGRDNDLQFPDMGSAGRRFGRNVPRRFGVPETGENLLSPNPREVSRRLLARDATFVPAKTLNLLAAGWIQFQVHDWFAHDTKSDGRSTDIEVAADDPWQGERPMRVACTPRTPRTALEREYRLASGDANQGSHWWDGSQLYGSDAVRGARLRDGDRLVLDAQGLLPLGEDGLPITGFNQNWWLGLELMHTLFAREHNAIAAHLRANYPSWTTDQVFNTARLINVALIAKIHTVEWTPGILAHPTLELSMYLHWWGLQGEPAHRAFGRLSDSELVSGIPGSRREHFEVPFSLTEEFVSVYRLHPLIPDEVELPVKAPRQSRRCRSRRSTSATRPQGDRHPRLREHLHSFGSPTRERSRCITTRAFCRARRGWRAHRLDIGTIDILRDRERGVPRYNEFRELLRSPRCFVPGAPGGDAKLSERASRGLWRGRHRSRRLDGRLPGGKAAARLRLWGHCVSCVRTDGVPPPQERPLLHRRLQRKHLHEGGAVLGARQHHAQRAPAPLPGARPGLARRQERLRSVALEHRTV